MHYTQTQIDKLVKNFAGTNWTNIRLKGGKVLADFTGEIIYPIGGGRMLILPGSTCRIFDISPKVLNRVFEYGSDQNGFMSQQFDYEPIN